MCPNAVVSFITFFEMCPHQIAYYEQENVGGAAFYSIFVTYFDLQRLILCVGFSPNITPIRMELQPQQQRQNPAWACHDDQQEVVG